jgi:glutaredoxin
MSSRSIRSSLRLAARSLPLLALAVALPGHAQYKVIGADGKVTYTDRIPNPGDGQARALNARTAPIAVEPELPLELRQVVNRYPVTLYTATGACEPCQTGRTLLRQRGIPYAEKQVLGVEDSQALEKLSGGRDAPTLAIGSQIVRGMSADLWNSYLDAAGYPRESKLPSSYQYKAPAPIVERREASAIARPDAQSAPPLRSAQPEQAAQGPSGIRF